MLRLIARNSPVARAARTARPTAAAADHPASAAFAVAIAARSSRRAFSSATPNGNGALPAATPAAAATAAPSSASSAAKPADATDSLPDLASFPADEDPAVTAKRLLLAEDVSRETNRRDLQKHLAGLAAILGLGVAYKVYRHYSYGEAVIRNPLRAPPRRPSPTFDPNPAAEESPLWELMRQMHPGIEPVPELAAEWARARAERQRRLEWDESPEGVAHWQSNKTKADWERLQYGFLQPIEVPTTPGGAAAAKAAAGWTPLAMTDADVEQFKKLRDAAAAAAQQSD